MEELDFIHSPSVNQIEVSIPPIRVLNVPNIRVFKAPSVPRVTVPVTVHIGKPIVDLPGCVEAHPEDEGKSPSLVTDDSDGTVVLCDGQYPSFDAMDYVPEEMTIVTETPPPPVQPPPDPPGAPEVPDTSDTGVETECPAPNQPRVGDLTTSGDEKVVGHELQGTVCVVLYEPTSAAEKFLPTANVVTTTATIAAVATASALFAKPLADLLLRVLKPAVKKATDAVKKKLGRKISLPSRSLKKTNLYRQKKGLPPLKG